MARRALTGRKLLVVSAGFATINYLGCEKADSPVVGNLPAPPPTSDAGADASDATPSDATPSSAASRADAEPEPPPVVGNLPAPPPGNFTRKAPPKANPPLEKLPAKHD